MKYNQKYNQHIPIFLEETPGDRNQWYFNRTNCKDECCWGVPLKVGQKVIISFERLFSVTPLDFNGADTIELMNLDGTTTGVTFTSLFTSDKYSFDDEGVLKQIYSVYFTFNGTTPCGKFYFRITDTENNTVWYSEYLQIRESSAEMHLLKVANNCQIGNVPFEKIFNTEFPLNGYEVYLDIETIIGDPEYITNETFIENANKEEIPVFKKEEKRYKFDTGYVPEYYSEFIALCRGFKNENSEPSCSIKFKDDDNFYIINRIENSYENDGFGCLLNNEFSFIIDTDSLFGCCDFEQVECPEEMAINVISKIKSQDDAESDVPTVGDIYVVPMDADINTVPNPEWQNHKNEYATWNGSDWDYSTPLVRDIILDTDNSNYWITNATEWFTGFSAVISVEDPPLFDCSPIIKSLIPKGYFGYIEESDDGINWTLTSPILNEFQIFLYVSTIFYPSPTSLEFRVVVIDLNGCGIPQSENKLYNCETH